MIFGPRTRTTHLANFALAPFMFRIDSIPLVVLVAIMPVACTQEKPLRELAIRKHRRRARKKNLSRKQRGVSKRNSRFEQSIVKSWPKNKTKTGKKEKGESLGCRAGGRWGPHPEARWKKGARPEAASCICLLYTSPSPRDGLLSRMPSSA